MLHAMLWGYSGGEEVCSLPSWRTAQIPKRRHQDCKCQMGIIAENKSSKDETRMAASVVYV